MAVREAYRYIPTKEPANPEIQKVQEDIIADLKQEVCVLVDPLVSLIEGDWFCKARHGPAHSEGLSHYTGSRKC